MSRDYERIIKMYNGKKNIDYEIRWKNMNIYFIINKNWLHLLHVNIYFFYDLNNKQIIKNFINFETINFICDS